jgi:hypothetical protein
VETLFYLLLPLAKTVSWIFIVTNYFFDFFCFFCSFFLLTVNSSALILRSTSSFAIFRWSFFFNGFSASTFSTFSSGGI